MADTRAYTMDAFLRDLQAVLHNLYDPFSLRQSPLIRAFGLEKRSNPGLALQDLIIQSVQDLRPRSEVPPQSNAWRLFNILTYRFIEQTNQAAVADAIGLSVRQLRREEHDSIQVLAESLWSRNRARDLANAQTRTAHQTVGVDLADATLTPGQDEELAWLRDSFPNERIRIPDLIASSLRALEPLARAQECTLQAQIAPDLPEFHGSITAMRQALMNLLLAAIRVFPGEVLTIAVTHQQSDVTINVTGNQVHSGSPLDDPTDLVVIARRFAEMVGGEIVFQGQGTKPGICRAALTLKASALIPVLVIDDNADTLRLLERYLSATRYQFVGQRDPLKAMAVVAEVQPAIIVTDVMMPGIDDWEMLGQLQVHPQAQHIPVIVCTILPQQDLAIALGAVGFLQKPVNRQAFLAELDRHTGRVAPTPR